MRRLAHFLAGWLAGMLVAPLAAHEVNTAITHGSAQVIQLRYADGKPLSFEAFEVVAEGEERPRQVGRTDGEGRAAVLPVPGKALVFTASTKDGHGARLTLPASAEKALSAPPAPAGAPRWLLAAAGLGVLFGLFGTYQLFFHAPRRTP